MNKEELKKKIIEVLEETEYEWTEQKNGYILQIFYDKLADVLIAAGIGDVKDSKHRAEVAERAVYNMAYGQWQREGARRVICEKYAPSTVRDYLARAEKELEEEGKDD